MKKKSAKASGKGLRGRDFVSVDDCSAGEFRSLFRLASAMKSNREKYRNGLEGKMMALIFEKPSLRTRTTFTVGIKQLGGDSLLLTPADISLGKRESVYDVAKNLASVPHPYREDDAREFVARVTERRALGERSKANIMKQHDIQDAARGYIEFATELLSS